MCRIAAVRGSQLLPEGAHRRWSVSVSECGPALCVRKNRTLAAQFKTNAVLKMISRNVATVNAMEAAASPSGAVALPASLLTDDAMEVEDEEADEDDVVADKGPDKAEIRDKIIAILEETGLNAERASKLDMDDFLKLLHAFNAQGIHFC